MKTAAYLIVCTGHDPVPIVDHGRAMIYAQEHHGTIHELVLADSVAKDIDDAFQQGVLTVLHMELA